MPQQPISDEVCDAIAGLLDLNIGIGNSDNDYYCDQQHCKIVGHQPKTNVPPPPNNTVVNDDGSTTSTNDEDSLYEVQSDDDSNDDSIFEHHTTEKRYRNSLKDSFTSPTPTCIQLTHLSLELKSK